MPETHMTTLLADTIGQFLANLLGGETEWYLAYRKPPDDTLGIVSTMPPDQLADLLMAQAMAIRNRDFHALRTHEIKLGEKPS